MSLLIVAQILLFGAWLLHRVAHDQGRGGYWYLRSKWKLSRQVAGLEEQLTLARQEKDALEVLFKQLREQVKNG